MLSVHPPAEAGARYGALHGEVQQMSRHKAAILPAIRPVQCLLLGLRRIRREYQIRINLWLSCLAPTSSPGACASPAADASDDLRAWLSQAPGQGFVAEVRWSLLRPAAAAARLRAARPCGRLNEQSLTTLLLEQGGAHLLDSVPSWEASCPYWQECVVSLSVRCVCPPANALHRLLLVMWRCLPPHSCCWAPPVSLVPLAWPHRLPLLQPHPPLPRTVPLELRSAHGLCVRRRHPLPRLLVALGSQHCGLPSAPNSSCGSRPAHAPSADSRAVPGRRRTACLDGTVAAPEACSPVAAGIHPPAERCYSRSPGKGANCKRCPRLCQSTAPSAPCCSRPLLRGPGRL